jgi:hypothetical protein
MSILISPPWNSRLSDFSSRKTKKTGFTLEQLLELLENRMKMQKNLGSSCVQFAVPAVLTAIFDMSSTAMDTLMDNGHLFNTIDENHFAVSR